MASILRSSKFVRFIAGFTRNVVVGAPKQYDGTLFNAAQHCYCGAVPRSLTSQVSTSVSTQHDQGLDQSLRRIDQDVRKSGRISRRDIEEILEEIRLSRSATSSQSLLVIRCCGSLVPEELPEVRTKLVQEIWTTLIKLNVPVDISHYNALLKVYLENEHPFSPTEFLAELEEKGIDPNQVTYQRLIARYCQVGDIEGATKILEFMKEKQLPVNESVFNALIYGHSQTGDMDSAQGILGVMLQAGLEPVVDTYTTLLCGYAKKGEIDKIREILTECESKDLFLLNNDYLDIVYALATNGNAQHVPDILKKVSPSLSYNQEAINCILRLINKGQEEAAFVVLQSMARQTKSDGNLAPTGHFFIKHLVRANRPVKTVLEMCNRLEDQNMYERALSLACETSLQLGNEPLAIALMEELQKKGFEIRQHFFWPLIVSKAGDGSGNGIMSVLKRMADFGLAPNNETLRDYVIPNLRMKSSQIIEKLREANISIGMAASCLVHSLLIKHEIEEAGVISGQVTAYYPPELMKRPLTSALYGTGDVKSYITVLRNFYENFDRKTAMNNIDEDDENTTPKTVDKHEMLGTFVLDLASNPRKFKEHIEEVLMELVEQGLSISTRAAEGVQDKLGESMTSEISSLLGKLTSGELLPVPIARKPPSYTPSHMMNAAQLERLIHNLTAKNQETRGLKRQLLSLYYRQKDLEKSEALLEDLKKDAEFTFSPGVYAQLADLYAYHDDLDRALDHFNKLKELEVSDFAMDEIKILRLAQLLVKHGRFEEGIKLLEETPRDSKNDERNYNYTSLVWRFLNSLAAEGRTEDLDKLFNTLVRKGYVEVSNILLGPLVKVHIVNNDIDKALEKFEWCVDQFKATPYKNELACKLIQIEEADKLQKLTDLSTKVHGEINSLYDLVFAFVECGRVRQARKILETPGLQSRTQRLNSACERYQQEGLVKPLEGLKDATKNLNHIDRTDIYHQLLLSYIKQEEPEKALGLWTQMQEEDIAPTDQFLFSLGTFLQNKGHHVPFAIPEILSGDPSQRPVEQSTTKSPASLFRQRLKGSELDGAIHIYHKSGNALALTDVSFLIEKLVQTERIGDATKITIDLLNKNAAPLTRVFRFLLNKLANAGDLESLNIIGSKVSQETKKIISFDNRVCHANLMAGRANEYLDSLEKEIDSAKEEDYASIGEKFPRGGAYGILERHPELQDKYERIAIKYGQRGIVAPLNVLWTNQFILGNYAKAEELWNTHLKDAPRIMFQRIVHTARDSKDEMMIWKLIEHLKTSNVTEGAIGNAYSCLLDVIVSNQNDAKLMDAFQLALKDAGLNHINRTAILRVKEVYERLGKPFDYQIPPRNPKGGYNEGMNEDDVQRS